jgi:hypothetical protein
LVSTRGVRFNGGAPDVGIGGYVERALEYPRIFAENVGNFGKYFQGNQADLEQLLNGDYCGALKRLKKLGDGDIALWICNKFAARTAQEGLLSLWYYEIYHIQSLATELVGKKGILGEGDYENLKLEYWNMPEYYEIRLAHYELNRYFIEILDGFFTETSVGLDRVIDTFFVCFWVVFSSITLFVNLAFLSNTSSQLTNDMKICRETFRIIDMRIVVWNPYLLNRVSKFFEFGKKKSW